MEEVDRIAELCVRIQADKRKIWSSDLETELHQNLHIGIFEMLVVAGRLNLKRSGGRLVFIALHLTMKSSAAKPSSILT